MADREEGTQYSDDEDDFELAIINKADLRKCEQIGDGQTSAVFRGTYQGVEVAIKEMHEISAMNPKDRLNLEREIDILRRVSHDHLVGFIGVMEHRGRIRIVTDFCRGGDAFDLLHNSGVALAWEQKTRMAKHVASAMEYLHSLDPPIIHRDLKSLNLLLSAPVRNSTDMPFVKVADFGLARMIDDFTKMTQNTGTHHWMAPELLGMEPYGCKVDVYSFSMVLYELICQRMPFEEVKPQLVCLVVARGQRPDLAKVPPEAPEYLKETMMQSWAAEPDERPSFSEIVTRFASAA
mmetsp:Transcript_23759/g.68400  ORF Transcript_23759/g.68400 Transcript_23759/m.68400 type:complete len:293 (+) Transcript_23759:62-940(+)